MGSPKVVIKIDEQKSMGLIQNCIIFSRPIKYRFLTIVNRYLFKIVWTTKEAIMYHLGDAR